MKYIFLDIDGVLATDKQMYMNAAKFQAKHEWAKDLKVLYPFDPDCVKIFNDILKESGAKIILSSDWKKFWNLDQLRTIFEQNGVIDFPIDVTKDFSVSMDSWVGLEKNRACQINEYIVEHNIEDFVVFDDLDVKKYSNPDYDDKIFLTRSSEGLKQSELKNKILNKLNSFES